MSYQWNDCERSFIAKRYDRIAGLITFIDWLLFRSDEIPQAGSRGSGARAGSSGAGNRLWHRAEFSLPAAGDRTRRPHLWRRSIGRHAGEGAGAVPAASDGQMSSWCMTTPPPTWRPSRSMASCSAFPTTPCRITGRCWAGHTQLRSGGRICIMDGKLPRPGRTAHPALQPVAHEAHNARKSADQAVGGSRGGG